MSLSLTRRGVLVRGAAALLAPAFPASSIGGIRRAPQVIVATGVVMGAESTMRFAHPLTDTRSLPLDERGPSFVSTPAGSLSGAARDRARQGWNIELYHPCAVDEPPRPARPTSRSLGCRPPWSSRAGRSTVVADAIDGLHERSSLRGVIHAQGLRCRECGQVEDHRADRGLFGGAHCPGCGAEDAPWRYEPTFWTGGRLSRGDGLNDVARLRESVGAADLVMAIGEAEHDRARVGINWAAGQVGTPVLIIDPEAEPGSEQVEHGANRIWAPSMRPCRTGRARCAKACVPRSGTSSQSSLRPTIASIRSVIDRAIVRTCGDAMSTTLNLLAAVERRLSVLETARALYRDRLAPDYNVFDADFFRFSKRGENGLSDVLAWLLDPSGSHGQGGRFLRIFTAQAGREWPSAVCERARTRREVSNQDQDGRDRPDIVIMSGSYLLVVENKEWAGEQPGQIARYVEFINALTGRHGILHRQLVFLTPEGRQPSSLSEADRNILIGEGSLVLARYRARSALSVVSGDEASDLGGKWAFSVIDWMDVCRMECASDRVSALIQEFQTHLRKRFDGIRDMSDERAIQNEIIASAGSMTAALSIARALPQLRTTLMRKLVLDIKNLCVADRSEYRVHDWWRDGGKTVLGGIKVIHTRLPDICFGIDFERSDYNGFAFGVPKQNRETDPDHGASVLFRNAAAFQGGNTAPQPNWWVWWRYCSVNDDLLPVERDWRDVGTPWNQIQDGSMAAKVMAAADRIYKLLDDGGVLSNT